jgi:hypothetical protein
MMDEQKFWDLIESSWKSIPMLNKLRKEAVKTNDASLFEGLSFGLDDDVVEALEEKLQALEKDDLIRFIHIMEEKLFRLDREEIHAYTDGTEEGFLHCRGFIIGMGEKYYKLIDKKPDKAARDIEAPSVCFIGYEVYKARFKRDFKRNTVFSTVSGSNPDGWRNG